MITNSGKEIIGRFLVGQTAAYASYLAVGCGAKPLSTGDTFGDYSEKKSLNYEMLRIPIISKTVINEDGVSKVVFTAEMPTSERYLISEVGVYPDVSNPIPTGLDSKDIILFRSTEQWKYHSSSTITNVPIQTGVITNYDNDIIISDNSFFTTSDNALFDNVVNLSRVQRYEQPRFLNSVLMLKGNSSVLSSSGSNLTVTSGSHIHLQNNLINLDSNSSNDELRLAFSVVNKNGLGSTDIPSNVKILIQFATTDDSNAEYANFAVNLDNGTSTGQWDFTNNRYVVISKKINDLYKTSGFSWSSVQYVKIYVCVNNGSTGSDNFFVAFDALRLENVSSFSNVYGLVAYTVIKSSDSLPIIKSDNSVSLIEFKYALDVL